jgi:amidase
MTVHSFQPKHYHNTFGPHEPVLSIATGDSVTTTTLDAHGMDSEGKQVAPGPNPQTGPFSVEGAEPGDMLALHLDHLYPSRDWGWSNTVVSANVVDPGYVSELPKHERAEWRIDRAAGTATLRKPVTRLGDLTLPLAPMLGCIGVAPAGGQAISTTTSAEHGGNMDYRGFTAGVTVYLPVLVPGALVHLGDGHAAQGDGEVAGTGIECSFDVRFTIRVVKHKLIRWPRGENQDFVFTVGNARPLDQAVQHATTEMLRWLQEDYGLDAPGASILLGQCAEYDMGNIFDPAYTMVCKVPKRLLGARKSGNQAH